MLRPLNRLRPLFSRRDKLMYGVMLLLMVGGALLEVVGIGAVPAFIATLATPDEVRALPYVGPILSALGIDTPTELVIWGALGLVVIFAIRTSYLIMLTYLQVRMTEHHRVRIAKKLFAAYMYAPYEFHLMRNTAELLRNVDAETKSIVTGIINPILTITLNGMMALCIVVLLVVATPSSGLVAIVVIGGGSWLFLRSIRARMRAYGEEARTERKRAIQTVNQGLGGLQDARVLGAEEAMIEAFNMSNTRYAKFDRFRLFIGQLSSPLLEFIAVAGLMLVALTMVLAGMELQSMVPVLGLFGAAIVRLRASMGTLLGRASQFSYNMASVDAVVDDLEALKKVSVAPVDESVRAMPLQRAITLEQVSYTYPGADRPALRDITLSIQCGQSVGFVGATGSGKTTLINVLLGLLKPQQGKILVDGVDVHDDLRGWQRNIGFIPQTIYLLDDTIRRNVAFGVAEENIDDEQVWAALAAAQFADHVRDLPEGLDTFVGERGVRLSGGQRQRLGLARALYRDPAVLILDEATSALDNETETEVMRALESFHGNRTIIMIAHRLSTVRNCDRLYFLNGGVLEAAGVYEELCAEHEGFRRMAGVEVVN